jgi:class 3 adenylate cyclase
LSHCLDIGIRHGGYHAGTLGDSILLYFGYPYASDNDVSRAARAASDLISAATEQNRVLGDRSGIRFDVRLGIHTGIVAQRHGEAPSGITPNTALELMRRARPGTVLASTTSCRLLGQTAGAYPLLENA